MKSRKFFKFAPKPLNTETFEGLYSILRVTVCHGNMSQVAKLLNISRATAFRWIDQPPQHYWWNHVLTAILNDVTDEMLAGTNKLHRQYAHKARREMKEYIPRNEELLEYDRSQDSDARRHILSLFREHDQLDSRMLRKAAYSGGYPFRTLSRAIQYLELHKETRGFGEDKTTYYRLPDGDD